MFLFITDSSEILSYLSELHNSIFNNGIVSLEVLHYENHNAIAEVQKKFMISIVLFFDV